MENRKRIIKALSLKRLEEGSIGFLTTAANEESIWYNVAGEPEVLKELIKNVIAKGNTIEFEYNNGIVGSLKLIEKAKEADKNWHDDMTNYEDLLNAAHEKANKGGFDINMISRPVRDGDGKVMVDFEKKTALYEAELTITAGGMVIQRIIDTGDAEGIENEKIKNHFNRMASTRAMARCYRIYTNNAKVAKEETE